MDLFVLHGIVEELNREIAGGFITKIYQMNRTDLLFRVRRQAQERQLLVSTHPDFFRLHLTEKKYAHPMVPPRFCTYLRKHITGTRVEEVIQDPFERVVRIVLQKKMDAGLTRSLSLVVELLGKASNVLLVEGDKILDCLHFRREKEGALRPAAPGLPYLPPPSEGRLSPAEVTQDKVGEIFLSSGGERWKLLIDQISGISPLLAREIDFSADATTSSLWESFRLLLKRYQDADFEPRIATLLGGKKILCPFPLSSLGAASEETFDSMNRAADEFYFEIVAGRQMADQKQSLAKRLRRLLSRLQKRRENLIQDREKFEKDLSLKDTGDLLTANYPRLKKGMREVEALDYRQDPPRAVLIPLDESLDPSGNVQRYFQRYKRAKRGLEFASRRREETEEEIAYLESVLYQVEEAEDPEELETIRGELEEEKIVPLKARKTGKERQEKSLPVRKFRSSEGLEIFCGKHNLGNDYLLRQLARENDLWFHVQGMPGSHVLLKVGRGEPKFESILEAATVAAFYSSGKNSTRLPVDYTLVKNVRRPKGAKPGRVTYFHQKTVMVAPEKEKVDKLFFP